MLGIIATIFGFIPFANLIVAIPVGIVGLIFGILALIRGGYPVKSWFGVGLSLLGIVLAIVTYVAIYQAVDDAVDDPNDVTVQGTGGAESAAPTGSASAGETPPAGGNFGLSLGTAVTVSNADREMSVVVNSVSELLPGEFDSPPGAGQHYIAANVSYECIRGECRYNSFDWTAKQEDGTQSAPEFLSSQEGRLNSGTLTPGNRVRGDVAFEVPVGTSGTIVLVEVLGDEIASWAY